MTKLEVLQSRRSIRAYSTESIDTPLLNKIKAAVTMVNSHEQGMKFQVFVDKPDALEGFSKSYGMFLNPRNYIAAVVDTSTPHALERAGYFAEQIVIRLTELGLGTCFVGGTYNPKKVEAQLRAGEELLFLILFGHAAEKDRFLTRIGKKLFFKKDSDFTKFFEPTNGLAKAMKCFPDLDTVLKAVACAPSSLNKRPTRVFLSKGERDCGALCAKVPESNPKNLIDLGIAKYNINYATDTFCDWGNGNPVIAS